VNIDLGDRAIQFDEKEGFAGGIIRMDRGFCGLDRSETVWPAAAMEL